MNKRAILRISLLALLMAGLCQCHSNFNGNWSAAGKGLDSSCERMVVYNGKLYAAGMFDSAGGVLARHIASWDGDKWSALGNGIPCNCTNIKALGVYKNELYVGAQLKEPYGVYKDGIWKWNGVRWTMLDSNFIGGNILAFTEFKGELYIGGCFDSIGNKRFKYIAKWNGTDWSEVSDSLCCMVYALTIYKDELYAAGYSGRNNMPVERWDGKNWNAVGKWKSPGDVFSLAVYNNELYASGNFVCPGSIIKWNGTRWDSLNAKSGFTGAINASTAFDGELYAGGVFNIVDGISTNNIALWDSKKWRPIGGIDWDVYCMAEYNGELYVGGKFGKAYNLPARNIVKWKRREFFK